MSEGVPYNPNEVEGKKGKRLDLGFWLAVVAFVLFSYYLFSSGRSPLKTGSVAPKLTLQSISNGKMLKGKWKGEVRVLHFWATWCPSCVRTLHYATKHAQELEKKGIKYMLINVDRSSSVSALKNFMASQGIKGKLLRYHFRDPSYRASSLYKVHTLPSSVVVERNGKVFRYLLGTLSHHKLSRILKRLDAI